MGGHKERNKVGVINFVYLSICLFFKFCIIKLVLNEQ